MNVYFTISKGYLKINSNPLKIGLLIEQTPLSLAFHLKRIMKINFSINFSIITRLTALTHRHLPAIVATMSSSPQAVSTKTLAKDRKSTSGIKY